MPAATAAIPLLALLAYATALARSFGLFMHRAIATDSDATSPMILAAALGDPHRGTVRLSTFAQYSTLLVDRLTQALPAHRTIWLAWPYASWLAAAGLLAWALHRVAGWWAALLGAILAVAVTPSMLQPLAAQAYHGTTVVTCVGLAVYLAELARHPPGSRLRRHTWWTVLAGLLTGANAASDPLLLVVGVAPFAVAVALLCARWRDRGAMHVARHAALLLAAGGIAYAGTDLAGQRLDIRHAGMAVHPAGLGGVVRQLQYLGGTAIESLGGTVAYQIRSARGAAELVTGGAVCALVFASAVASAVTVVRCPARATPPDRRRRIALLTIWSLIALATVASLVVSDAARDFGAVRYALPLWPALAVALSLAGARSAPRRRVAATAAAAAVVAANAHAISAFESAPFPRAGMEALLPLLESQGIHRAYADYWEANSLTWLSDGKLQVRPVLQSAAYCDPADPRRLCAYKFNAADGWFAPRASWCAVIVDPKLQVARPPSATYGTPVRVTHIGDLIVYVYDHDLAPFRTAS